MYIFYLKMAKDAWSIQDDHLKNIIIEKANACKELINKLEN